VYNELRETTKKFLLDVTVINPHWLPVIAKNKYRKIAAGADDDHHDPLIRALVEAQRSREQILSDEMLIQTPYFLSLYFYSFYTLLCVCIRFIMNDVPASNLI
jgi:hypothetical protein